MEKQLLLKLNEAYRLLQLLPYSEKKHDVGILLGKAIIKIEKLNNNNQFTTI